VGENAVTAADQVRAEECHRLETSRIRQLLVVDREVDVQTRIGSRGDVLVQTAFEIDHDVDAVGGDTLPIGNRRRDEEESGVVDLEEVHPAKGIKRTPR